MGNRLWASLNVIAFAIETKQTILFPHFCFEEYLKQFQNLTAWRLRRRGIFFLDRTLLFDKIVNKVAVRLLKVKNRGGAYKYIHHVDSWEIGNVYAKKHSDFLRTIFRPPQSIIEQTNRLFDTFEKNRLIVGIHIRRGDYKEWVGGKYYYDLAVYKKAMRMISATKNGDILFYLFSNEDISGYDFGMNCYFNPDTEAVFDMWAMSKCNYILGPPSTFSMFASFWGQTPLCFLHHEQQQITLSDFSPVVAQNLFANGKEIWDDYPK